MRGICRIFKVSLTWLPGFVARLYGALPADLGIDSQSLEPLDSTAVHILTVEADEMWSFVAKKSNKQWICIAMDARTRQVIAFNAGDRSKESAQMLWDKIPDAYRKHATFHTDLYDSYMDIIPREQQRQVTKQTISNASIAQCGREFPV